jgi:hypothetical protein
MTAFTVFSSARRVLLLGTLLAAYQGTLAANPLFTLKGETLDARLPSEAEVRISVLGMSPAEEAQAVVDAYRQFQADQNAEPLTQLLQRQTTQGYVFTREATGYTIKYAWQSEDALDRRLVLLVTPGLKTRNPYLWKQRNDATAFSVLEVRWQGEEALVTSSTDYPIGLDLQGRLELLDDSAQKVFARVRDATPYYLRERS